MSIRSSYRSGETWSCEVGNNCLSIFCTYFGASGACARSAAEQDAWETTHRAFHAELTSACQMPLLRQFCATLHDQSDRYRRIFLKKHAPDRTVPAEHTALAHAAIERRTRDATRILREHIERTGRNSQAALLLSTK